MDILTDICDMRVIGERMGFNTNLPKSFIGALVGSLKRDGVDVLDIRDDGQNVHIIKTSLCEVKIKGAFSVEMLKKKLRNTYYGILNKRFDERAGLLREKGYRYYRKYNCFAASEKQASIGGGITNGAIMHENDFLFNLLMEEI